MGGRVMLPLLLCLSAAGPPLLVQGGDPYLFFTWNVTYGSISPLGTPQQGILINNQFPRPNINSTTTNNIVINVFNYLDEPFLLTWNGIQHRKNSWQDGVLGTHCPIPPKTNYIYRFQPARGFGGLRINSRLLIPVPYDDLADGYTILAGDWFSKGHIALKKILDSGRNLGRCDGFHINGKVAKGDGKDEPLFTIEPGKTYKFRICNVGIKTALNIRFQGHNMRLVEMEGSHTMQSMYDSLDVHVGQCYSVLVMANQEPMDYYVVASTRFTRQMVTATGIIRYTNGKGVASSKLPPPPTKLAEYYNVVDKVFKYDNIVDDPPTDISKITLDPIVLNLTYRDHLRESGKCHSIMALVWLFILCSGTGTWSPKKRKNYILLDVVSRHTIQVFPQSLAAILLTFDNCGMWNIRSEIWDRHYLGQQLYVSVLSSACSLKDEYNMPDNSPLCRIVESMPKPQPCYV
ncbi:hypothetical protein Goshw_019272 [Gossypium schwendimanii]|uniref:Plastocyanin-like domain-containing protein n=1 Tax=Gossypium schwendimanii TaxID=34291 RepID=A0A7J9L4F2_GOSSC|nr:hypothetical protein [Gossypium schwendimanii]